MASVKSTNTRPELIIRKLLHKDGFRFRLHKNDLPGKPDISLPMYKTIIFVHGCFWHQHPLCKYSIRPNSNVEYWNSKLDHNIVRDKKNIKLLRDNGWKVIIIWECETRNSNILMKKLKYLFISRKKKRGREDDKEARY